MDITGHFQCEQVALLHRLSVVAAHWAATSATTSKTRMQMIVLEHLLHQLPVLLLPSRHSVLLLLRLRLVSVHQRHAFPLAAAAAATVTITQRPCGRVARRVRKPPLPALHRWLLLLYRRSTLTRPPTGPAQIRRKSARGQAPSRYASHFLKEEFLNRNKFIRILNCSSEVCIAIFII